MSETVILRTDAVVISPTKLQIWQRESLHSIAFQQAKSAGRLRVPLM